MFCMSFSMRGSSCRTVRRKANMNFLNLLLTALMQAQALTPPLSQMISSTCSTT